MKPSRRLLLRAVDRALAEQLEGRRMLSGAKPASLTTVGQDLTSLYATYQSLSSAAKANSLNIGQALAAAQPGLAISGDVIPVEAHAKSDGAALQAQLEAIGATTTARDGLNMSMMIPVSKLGSLGKLSALAYVRPVYARLHTGSVASQADTAIRSSNLRSTYAGVTGAGIKVGVLSDSFDTGPGSYSADVTSGDLPSGVTVLAEYAGGTDEGRAMAQLIYDEAPGITLAYATAFTGDTAFAANIKALRDAGCKVIVDDVGYFNEPYFQDGPIAQAVDNVTATGVTYLSAAGNSAQESYDSVWRTGNVRANGSVPVGTSLAFFGGTTFDFDTTAGIDDLASFTVATGQSMSITLQWDQSAKSASPVGSTNDLDVYVLNSSGTVVAASYDDNINGDPVEIVQYVNSSGNSTLQLMIVQYTAAGGPTAGRVKFIDNFGTTSNWQYALNSGTSVGHPNSATGIGVAAARYDATPAYGTNPPVAEYFTSYGGVPILFNTAGVAISPVTRQQPWVTGVDGADTTFFGQDYEFNGLPNFFGTSAAAPSVAGVVALMLQRSPNLTPAQVKTALGNTALNMSTAGFDYLTGMGLVRADNALAAVSSTVGGVVFEDHNSDGVYNGVDSGLAGVTVYVDYNNNSIKDATEPSAVTVAGGAYSIPSVFEGTYNVREIVPAGYIAANPSSGARSVVVPIAGTVSSNNYGNFPIVFNGTSGNDAYYVKASGTLAQIWVGAVPPASATWSIPRSQLPSLTFTPGFGDDSLVLDYTGGALLDTGTVTYDGGPAIAAGNTLDIRGSAYPETFTFTSATSYTRGGLTTAFSNISTLKMSNTFANINANLGALALEFSNNADVAFNVPQTISSILINSNADIFSNVTSTLSAGVTVGSINVQNGKFAMLGTQRGGVLKLTGALTIGSAGKLDLSDNGMVIASTSPVTRDSLRAMLIAGRGSAGTIGGGWNTAGGIVSTGFSDTTDYSLGYIKNNAATLLTDPILSYHGEPVGAADMLVRYTHNGDATCDGTVDDTDVAVIGLTYDYAASGNHDWWEADFDYSSKIDDTDVAVIGLSYPQFTPLSPAAAPALVPPPAAGNASSPSDDSVLSQVLFSQTPIVA